MLSLLDNEISFRGALRLEERCVHRFKAVGHNLFSTFGVKAMHMLSIGTFAGN
jgi:hypothetical protein